MSKVFVFTKSGSKVEKVSKVKSGLISVRRLDTQKEMLVPETALSPVHDKDCELGDNYRDCPENE